MIIALLGRVGFDGSSQRTQFLVASRDGTSLEEGRYDFREASNCHVGVVKGEHFLVDQEVDWLSLIKIIEKAVDEGLIISFGQEKLIKTHRLHGKDFLRADRHWGPAAMDDIEADIRGGSSDVKAAVVFSWISSRRMMVFPGMNRQDGFMAARRKTISSTKRFPSKAFFASLFS